MNMFLPLILSMLTSQEELRFAHVFKQGYDMSCGISVTATLLNKYWNIPIEDAELYKEMILDRTGDEKLTYTINFVTITDFLRKKDLQSMAFKMDWDKLVHTLEQGYAPIIIHYEKPMPHFVLLLHIENGYAFVADPARGYEAVAQNTFMHYFSGNVLLAASRVQKRDEASLELAINEKQTQLNRLQQMARRR